MDMQIAMSRQSDIIPQDHDIRTVMIVGVGSIGSNVADMLASMGITSFILVDHDFVGEENIFPARFDIDSIGEPKVEAAALKLEMSYGINSNRISTVQLRVEDAPEQRCDLLILCTDSLSSRANAFRGLSDRADHIIDARIGGHSADVFYVRSGSTDALQHYNERLDDLEDTELPCGMKATSPLTKGFVPGMVGQVVHHLMNGLQPPYWQTVDLYNAEVLIMPSI